MTVGNRTPQVTIEIPEDGQIASFTDQIAYRINVTDPEDGTTGAGINCADVQVTVSLGHDEHSHGLSQATGCTGTVTTGLTSGHGAEANTFTVIGVAYTDKGGPGGIAPLTGRAQAILQPKTKQAEFFASTGRVAGATGAPPARHAEHHRRDRRRTEPDRDRGRRLRLLQAGQPQEHLRAALPRRVGDQHGLDRGPPGLPHGHARGRDAQIAATGGAQTYKTVELPITPTGRHARAVPRVPQPGRDGSLMNLNQFEFVGQGAAITAPPAVTVNAIPAAGNAPLNVVFDTTATDPDGAAPLTYAWSFGDGRPTRRSRTRPTSTRLPATTSRR